MVRAMCPCPLQLPQLLRSVNVRACNLVTLSSFEALAECCAELCEVKLSGIHSPADTMRIVNAVRARRPSCIITW
jgi:hypothetical protein